MLFQTEIAFWQGWQLIRIELISFFWPEMAFRPEMVFWLEMDF